MTGYQLTGALVWLLFLSFLASTLTARLRRAWATRKHTHAAS